VEIWFKMDDDEEPFMILEAESIHAVPTAIRPGPSDWGVYEYASELAAVGSSVMAILSRMGQGSYAVAADGRNLQRSEVVTSAIRRARRRTAQQADERATSEDSSVNGATPVAPHE